MSNLMLFPQPDSETTRMLVPSRHGLEQAIARFTDQMADPDSPIRAIRKQEARAALFADMPASVAPALKRSLHERGIHQLYTHQQEAFAIAESGRNVAIVTPTASGKTLCYNLPVLNKILANPGARAASYRLRNHTGQTLSFQTYDPGRGTSRTQTAMPNQSTTYAFTLGVTRGKIRIGTLGRGYKEYDVLAGGHYSLTWNQA